MEEFGGEPTPSTSTTTATTTDISADIDLSSPPTENTTTTPTPVNIGEDTPQRRTLLLGLVEQFAVLFGETLNPVNPKAQKKVPVPAGLDLDKMINEPEEDDEDEEEKDDGYTLEVKDEDIEDLPKKPLTKEEKEEGKKRLAEERARREHDPYYIKDSRPTKDINVDDIPIKNLAKDDLPDLKMEKKSKHKKKNLLADDAPVPAKKYTIIQNEEMPDGAAESDEEKEKEEKEEDEVDLLKPLGADEVIPKIQAYAQPQIGGGKKRRSKQRQQQRASEK